MELNWTKLNPLNSEEVNKINEAAGVYRISHLDSSNNKYYVHYVGQAENLKERLGQHLLDTEVNSCCNKLLKNYRCFFRACAISTQNNRDGAEVALYEKYSPTCVERIPDVGAIDINFE